MVIAFFASLTGICIDRLVQKHSCEIKIEASPPLVIRPLSDDLGDGCMLVEIWTKVTVQGITVDVPHIVKLSHKEYVNYINSGKQ